MEQGRGWGRGWGWDGGTLSYGVRSAGEPVPTHIYTWLSLNKGVTQMPYRANARYVAHAVSYTEPMPGKLFHYMQLRLLSGDFKL